jgi:signal recognition particle subunit SRP54
MLSATSHLVFFLLVSQCLSQVAATESPIIFIGTGEHIDDFEPFNVRSFVSRLLGMGDLSGLVEKMKDTNMGDQTEMIKRMTQGQFSLRDMQEQFKNVLKMGSYVICFCPRPSFSCFRRNPTRSSFISLSFSQPCVLRVCAFCVRRCHRISSIMSMLPGFNSEMIPKGKEEEGTARIKRFITILDSMNAAGAA